MPSRNTIRCYDVNAFYHVYNRGSGSRDIFHDDEDREKFLSLFARHLDPEVDELRMDGVPYEKYCVDVVAYCLMKNHFHLLLYQYADTAGITQLMRSVGTAYTMYYNSKYKQSGSLFQGVFKASRIVNESYLAHITRYIHMNPRSYLHYRWSSIGYFLGEETPGWVNIGRVDTMTPDTYKEFLESYEGRKKELSLIKEQLAI